MGEGVAVIDLEVVAPNGVHEPLIERCLRIVGRSPEYFSAGEIEQMRRGLAETDDLYTASVGGEVAGFAAVRRRSEQVAEVLWLAVDLEHRGRGIGSMLLGKVIADLHSTGAEVLEVKILAEEAGYPPYKATRRFYEKLGFIHLETIDPYPGWEPGNPCAIYVKVLRAEQETGERART